MDKSEAIAALRALLSDMEATARQMDPESPELNNWIAQLDDALDGLED